MKQELINNDFWTEDPYKLYRSVYEIIHPTISKKNISNYKIIVREDLLPLRIFYPSKISKMEKIIIYIHGKKWGLNNVKSYTDVCSELVSHLDLLVVAVDYSFVSKDYMQVVNECYQTVKYLYQEFVKVGIEPNSIIMLGDSIGASILSNMMMLEESNFVIHNLILLYPALDLTFRTQFPSVFQNSQLDLLTMKQLMAFKNTYVDMNNYVSPLYINDYSNWPNTLLVTGDLDPLRDEGIGFIHKIEIGNKKSKNVNIKFASHGFLNSKDEEAIEECYQVIQKFILDIKKGSYN